jgi:HK97 family phage major capsid protein
MDENTQKVLNEIKSNVDGLKSTIDGNKKSVEQIQEENNSLKEQLKNLPSNESVQKMQEQVNSMDTEIKQLGEHQGKADKFKSRSEIIEETLEKGLKPENKEAFLKELKSEKGKDIELKSEINISNSFTTTYYESIPSDPLTGVQMAPRPRPTIYDLLTKRPTTKLWVPYNERTGETDNSEMVGESTAPGSSSDLSFEDKAAKVKKISEKMYVPQDSLDDIPYLRSQIDEALGYHIPLKREKQIIEGAGTSFAAGTELKGFLKSGDPIAKIFSQPTGLDDVTSPNNVDVLRAAMVQCMLGQNTDYKTGYMPNGIVLHPVQVANMELTKNADGLYELPGFFNPNGLSIKGVPIIENQFMDPDTYLVGDFRRSIAAVRKALNIKVLDQNASYGEEDVLTFVVSMRMAFFVPSPHEYAFTYGTFEAGKSALRSST